MEIDHRFHFRCVAEDLIMQAAAGVDVGPGVHPPATGAVAAGLPEVCGHGEAVREAGVVQTQLCGDAQVRPRRQRSMEVGGDGHGACPWVGGSWGITGAGVDGAWSGALSPDAIAETIMRAATTVDPMKAIVFAMSSLLTRTSELPDERTSRRRSASCAPHARRSRC